MSAICYTNFVLNKKSEVTIPQAIFLECQSIIHSLSIRSDLPTCNILFSTFQDTDESLDLKLEYKVKSLMSPFLYKVRDPTCCTAGLFYILTKKLTSKTEFSLSAAVDLTIINNKDKISAIINKTIVLPQDEQLDFSKIYSFSCFKSI